MRIDAKERVTRHRNSLLNELVETADCIRGEVDQSGFAQGNIADQSTRCCGLGQAEMTMAECIDNRGMTR